MKVHKIIIGSRGSQLALWQANWVKTELEYLYNNISFSEMKSKPHGADKLDISLVNVNCSFPTVMTSLAFNRGIKMINVIVNNIFIKKS